jgi:hypothetical protein
MNCALIIPRVRTIGAGVTNVKAYHLQAGDPCPAGRVHHHTGSVGYTIKRHVRKKRISSGEISNSSLNAPVAIAFDDRNNFWITDAGNNRILMIHEILTCFIMANQPRWF